MAIIPYELTLLSLLDGCNHNEKARKNEMPYLFGMVPTQRQTMPSLDAHHL